MHNLNHPFSPTDARANSHNAKGASAAPPHQQSTGARSPQRRQRQNHGKHANTPKQRHQNPNMIHFQTHEDTTAIVWADADLASGPGLPQASRSDTALSYTQDLTQTPTKGSGAYAGPMFHASPAPESLPMPKFFCKAVKATSPPANASKSAGEWSDAASSTSSSPSSPSESRPVELARFKETTIDSLFQRHKEEQARNNGQSTDHTTSGSFGGAPSPVISHQARQYQQRPYGPVISLFPSGLDGQTTPRSVTAPSRIPQSEQDSYQESEDDRHLSQNIGLSSQYSAPRTANSTSMYSPSPFFDASRVVSGPTTPTVSSDSARDPAFYYGNRNLSPLFKQAQADSPRRNSGLRTEIKAGSSRVPQTQVPGMDGGVVARHFLGNIPHPMERRFSAPQIEPLSQPKNTRKPRAQAPRPSPNRPGSFPINQSSTSTPTKPRSSAPFTPSSVQAKLHSARPPQVASPSVAALEHDLKRLLNLTPAVSATAAGV
ncbi:hypothetical protein GQ43DRAFT_436929 [Delitschia confertaspora ATCC 74209]|uniref:Proteophosphoglycan 5 n=1 Tax=Delitschia confertaspora ATCC 74209 TaxID=1513339 RepID=A0A9P4JYL8_9PLEO|nr:hypothetical protein GQ43DRAFT_436929 [Delitschia confertaspora ATCC 74209]